MNARVVPRWMQCGIVMLAAAMVIGLLCRTRREQPNTAAAHKPSAPATALESTLAQLQQAWQPEDRQRVLAAAAEQAERWATELPAFLLRGTSPLLRAGCELAAHLRVHEALPAIHELALRPDLRLPALAAADTIEPLPDGDITELLADDGMTIVLAGLEMAKRRDPPLPELIELLAHENDLIADAAMKSLPLRLPESWKEPLEELSCSDRPEVATRAFRALLRIGADAPPEDAPTEEAVATTPAGVADPTAPSPSREELLRTIDGVDEATRVQALESLGRAPEPEDGPMVLNLLERDGSDAVRKQACLFLGHVKHRDAVRPLIDVLAQSEDEGLRANAHWALQQITGQELRNQVDVWQRWWSLCGSQSITSTPR